MEEEIITVKMSCFVCCDFLAICRPATDTSNYSQKPIYKFIESFTGYKIPLNVANEAQVCLQCFEEICEYDNYCKKAALIQEQIAHKFQNSQMKMEEKIKCSTCYAEFDNIDEMEDHECIVDEELCVEYVEHVEEHVEEYEAVMDEFELEEEPKIKSEISPTTRRTQKTSNLIYECDKCEKVFDKKKDYMRHVKLDHLEEGAEIFPCAFCPESQDNFFTSEMELKLHHVVKHSIEKDEPLTCPACPKTFNSKALLTRHFGLHSKEKPLVCDICGKRYFHTSSFHMHQIAHKGIKGHSCHECGKSFISTSHLNRHLKTHTGEKIYECEICKAKFALRYNLKAHMNTHYGISRKRKPKRSEELLAVTEIQME